MKRLFFSLFFVLCSLQLMAEAITWSGSPITISSMGTDATDVQVGVDSSGTAVAVWLENGFVVSKTNPAMGTWTGMLSILSATGTASSPQLVVDIDGNATAIWVENGEINTATQPVGMGWGSVTTLAASGGSEPQIAVDASKNLVAIWVENGEIHASTKLFIDMSWPAMSETLASAGDSPQVAISANGTATAVWHGIIPISLVNGIFSSSETVSVGTWGTAVTVSDPSIDSVFPSVAMDPNGNALTGWFTYTLTNLDDVLAYSNVIFTASYFNGISWSTPAPVSNPGIRNPADLGSKIVFTGTNAIAVWLNSLEGSTFNVGTSIFNSGQSWLLPQDIDGDTYALNADLSATSIGDAFAIFNITDPMSDPMNPLILTVISNSEVNGPIQQFWFSTTVSTPSGNTFSPVVAAIANNMEQNFGAAAWTSFDGMNKTIEAVMGSGDQLEPPTGLSAMQTTFPHGVFDEFINVLTWTDSMDPNVTTYLIYRNNVLITQVSPGTMTFTDNNAAENQPVLYGVAAMGAMNTVSPIDTFILTFP